MGLLGIRMWLIFFRFSKKFRGAKKFQFFLLQSFVNTLNLIYRLLKYSFFVDFLFHYLFSPSTCFKSQSVQISKLGNMFPTHKPWERIQQTRECLWRYPAGILLKSYKVKQQLCFQENWLIRYLTLSPTAYQILWLLRGGASEAPPKISKKESYLTPCCYIAFVCLYI